MTTKATKASAARARARREKGKQGDVGVAGVAALEVIAAICAQLPAPADAGEMRVWNWMLLVDGGMASRGEMEAGRKGLEENETWRRLMEPAAVEKRRRMRRRVEEALSKFLDEV